MSKRVRQITEKRKTQLRMYSKRYYLKHRDTIRVRVGLGCTIAEARRLLCESHKAS